MLRSSIWRTVSCWKTTSNTRNANNLTCFILHHVLNKALNVIIWTMNIDIKQLHVIFESIILKRASHRNSCIFNNNVEFPVFSLEIFNHLFGDNSNCIIISHVHPNNCYMAGPITLFFDSFKLWLIACRYDDVCPKAIEFVSKVLS